MAIVGLEGMRFYGFHGVYREEQLTGTEFILDIYIDFHMREDLTGPVIDYEHVYDICAHVMKDRQDLIENVVVGIANKMEVEFGEMLALKIRMRKVNPPLKGRVDNAIFVWEKRYD